MIQAYLKDTIGIKFCTSGTNGEKSFSATATNVKGRFYQVEKVLTDVHGETVVSSGKILFPSSTSLSYNDLLIYNGRNYRVVSFEYKGDFTNRLLIVRVK